LLLLHKLLLLLADFWMQIRQMAQVGQQGAQSRLIGRLQFPFVAQQHAM